MGKFPQLFAIFCSKYALPLLCEISKIDGCGVSFG